MGATDTNPHVIAMADFHERQLAPKRSFVKPPATEVMLRPKGAVQVALNGTEVAAGPEDARMTIEAR